jgi:O-antigen/teichoic acid export membrane protein
MTPGETLGHRARRASAWSGIDAGLRALLGFGITVALARLVAPDEFGVLAMVLVFSAIAGVLVDFGIGTALIQRRDADHVDESTAFYFNLGMSLVLAFLLVLAAPWIARFFAQPELEGITWVMAANLIVGALGAIHTTLLTKELNFRPLMWIGLWSSLLSGVLAIALAWRGFGAWSLAWQALAQSTITTVLLWWWHPWRPLRRFDPAALRRLLGFGGHVMAARLIDAVYTRMYSVFIGKLFSAASLGFYSRAQSTQQLPTNLMTGVLNRVALPAFAEAAQHPARLSAALAKTTRLLMFINLPVMLGVGLTAEPLVQVLFGQRWLPSAPLLQILCLAGALFPLQVLNLSALLAQGHSRLLLRIEILKKSLGMLLLAVAAAWGLEAIAWSQVIAACFAFFINAHYSGRLLAFGGVAQLRAISRIALASLAMAAVVAGIDLMVQLPPLPRLALLAGTGAATYLVASLLLGELSVAKIRETAQAWWPGQSGAA